MLFVSALRGFRNEVSGVIIVIWHSERPVSLHLLHVTSKPCRLHRHPDRTLPQPAGTVRADAEVKTRAVCD